MTAKISASADGLKVTIGNAAEDALEIDQTAKTIKGINGYSMVPAVQTWQNMTASRVSGTTYNNDTGVPIEVSLMAIGPTAGFGNAQIAVGGVVVSRSYSTSVTGVSNMSNATATVPAGAAYVLTWTGTPTVMELR